MKNLEKRIIVVGVSASGKSTFARELSEKVGIPATYMDAIMWKPGWEYIGDEETTKRLKKLSITSMWLIEGYISTMARTTVFERADTIIYLDYSPVIASWRYIRRWWKHRNNARPELPGSPEKLSWEFLKRVWYKKEAITLNKFLAKVKNQKKIIVLHSPTEAQKFLNKMV